MRQFGSVDLDLVEQIFEQLPDSPFFVKNKDLQYVAANSAMARLCGARRVRDLYGKCVRDFFPEALAARYEILDRNVINSGKPLTNYLDLSVDSRNRPAWLIFSRVPVRAATGEPVGVIAVSRQLKAFDGSQSVYQRLSQIAERIRKKFDEPLQLDALAALAKLSKSQLERDFVRVFGLSPREFHQQARMRHALQLLQTELSIAQVAYECGYSDHSAFTRRFQKSIGLSPRDFRNGVSAQRQRS